MSRSTSALSAVTLTATSLRPRGSRSAKRRCQSQPAERVCRERVADPAEARDLIDALPDGDRALWATAIYTGIRRGELRKLCWSDIDLDDNIISVSRTRDGARCSPFSPNQAREAAHGGRSQLVRASVSSLTSLFRREGEAIARHTQ